MVDITKVFDSTKFYRSTSGLSSGYFRPHSSSKRASSLSQERMGCRYVLSGRGNARIEHVAWLVSTIWGWWLATCEEAFFSRLSLLQLPIFSQVLDWFAFQCQGRLYGAHLGSSPVSALDGRLRANIGREKIYSPSCAGPIRSCCGGFLLRKRDGARGGVLYSCLYFLSARIGVLCVTVAASSCLVGWTGS